MERHFVLDFTRKRYIEKKKLSYTLYIQFTFFIRRIVAAALGDQIEKTASQATHWFKLKPVTCYYYITFIFLFFHLFDVGWLDNLMDYVSVPIPSSIAFFLNFFILLLQCLYTISIQQFNPFRSI